MLISDSVGKLNELFPDAFEGPLAEDGHNHVAAATLAAPSNRKPLLLLTVTLDLKLRILHALTVLCIYNYRN